MNDLFKKSDDPDEKFYDKLVGEGKKFADPEALAKGKWHADATIETLTRKADQLQAEIDQLMEEGRKRMGLEQLIDQYKTEISQPRDPPKVEDKPAVQSLEEYEKLIESKLSQHETKKRQEENYNIVEKALKERYGSKYSDVLENLMKETGVDQEFINFNARNNPKVLLKMLEKSEPETFQAPPRSQRGYTQKPAEKHTWSWYQNLKKTNPSLYRDPKTTAQMAQDYAALGREFEDGDFLAYGQSSAL